MKAYFSSLLFLVSYCNCVAQQDTLFLSEEWIETSKETAQFYRIETSVFTEKEMVMVEDYYLDGQLKMVGYFTFPKSQIRQGRFVFYHRNGTKASEGNFEKGHCAGDWIYWYKNGVKKETRFFETPEPTKELSQMGKVIDLWDSTGRHLVVNGTGDYQSSDDEEDYTIQGRLVNSRREGEWLGRYENGAIFFKEKYQNDVLISGVSYDSIGTEYRYKELAVQPEPKVGMHKFYVYISKNLRYPKAARRQGIEGKVFVQFFINEEGKIVDVKAIKGISQDCDEAAEKVVAGAPDWTPGIQRGQRVKVKMILPITFKIH